MILKINLGENMAGNSTLRILDGLRADCKNDENLKSFLESILSEEIKGKRLWRDYYNKFLNKSIGGWTDNED